VLIGIFVAILAAVAVIGERTARRVLREHKEHAAAIAAPMMPALGSCFAVLAALAVATTAEWSDVSSKPPSEGSAFEDLTTLERNVRLLGRDATLDSAERTELLDAIDRLSSSRRDRFSGSGPVSAGVVALLLATGIILVLNASGLSIAHPRRAAVAVIGLVVVVGMSIAMVIALGSPFAGAFIASPSPILDVQRDLAQNRFQLTP
jgi:hypothetical protein